MTHLSDVLASAGIPEDLKQKIREAAGRDMRPVAWMAVNKDGDRQFTTNADTAQKLEAGSWWTLIPLCVAHEQRDQEGE